MYKKIAMLILLISMSFAQEKIGAVFSERIFANFSEYKDVEEQLQLDLSNLGDIKKAYDWSLDKSIDVFIHCAGSNPLSSLKDADLDRDFF